MKILSRYPMFVLLNAQTSIFFSNVKCCFISCYNQLDIPYFFYLFQTCLILHAYFVSYNSE